MRAGCYDPSDHGRFLGKHITEERNRPGHRVQNLGDSSFDTWIKLYRPTSDTLNSQTNYYQRGALVAFLLDMYIRRESDDERSLDDFMRHMWAETFKKGRGVEEDEIGALVEAATGISVSDFLEQHILGTHTLDFDDALAHVGLYLRGPKKETPFVGATIRDDRGDSRLERIRIDGPAHAAGWMAEDVIVAIDGHRVRGDLTKRLELHEPGETVSWTAFRRDRLVDGTIEVGVNPNAKLEILPVDSPSDAQQAAFRAWTHGRELDDWKSETDDDPA